MRRSHASEEDGQAGVNLTPMLDMAFILLIFFIVTASFTREQGLPLERPSAASAEPLDKAPVVVSLGRDGASRVGDRPVPMALLRQALARAGRDGGVAERVVIVADRRVPAGRLVQAMDAARLAGVGNVGIATRGAEP